MTPFDASGIQCPEDPGRSRDPALRAQLSDLSRRVEAASKVVEYREALEALQKSPSFESIANRRAELAEQVSQNSALLWKD